jgi:hypothetical protein
MTLQSLTKDSAVGHRRQGVRTFVIQPLVVILALLMFWYAGTGAFVSTRDGLNMLDGTNPQVDALRQRSQFEQLRRDLAAQVPPGTRMYPELPWDLWRHRLIEFGIMAGARMVPDPGQAQVRVKVVEDPAAPNGVRLVVTRVG